MAYAAANFATAPRGGVVVMDGERRATLPSITDDYLDSLMGNPFAIHMPPALPPPSPEKQRAFEDPSFQEAFFAARAKVYPLDYDAKTAAREAAALLAEIDQAMMHTSSPRQLQLTASPHQSPPPTSSSAALVVRPHSPQKEKRRGGKKKTKAQAWVLAQREARAADRLAAEEAEAAEARALEEAEAAEARRLQRAAERLEEAKARALVEAEAQRWAEEEAARRAVEERRIRRERLAAAYVDKQARLQAEKEAAAAAKLAKEALRRSRSVFGPRPGSEASSSSTLPSEPSLPHTEPSASALRSQRSALRSESEDLLEPLVVVPSTDTVVSGASILDLLGFVAPASAEPSSVAEPAPASAEPSATADPSSMDEGAAATRVVEAVDENTLAAEADQAAVDEAEDDAVEALMEQLVQEL
jgi:hypothetical protein